MRHLLKVGTLSTPCERGFLTQRVDHGYLARFLAPLNYATSPSSPTSIGKTTLVDKILHYCELFRENRETGELILDSNDLERERGITILSKNVSVRYKGVKINLIDTPGHLTLEARWSAC